MGKRTKSAGIKHFFSPVYLVIFYFYVTMYTINEIQQLQIKASQHCIKYKKNGVKKKQIPKEILGFW